MTFKFQLASRSLHNQISPIIYMKITTFDGKKQVDHVLQTDITNLVHMTKVLEEALNEMKSNHCRRILRNIKWLLDLMYLIIFSVSLRSVSLHFLCNSMISCTRPGHMQYIAQSFIDLKLTSLLCVEIYLSLAQCLLGLVAFAGGGCQKNHLTYFTTSN